MSEEEKTCRIEINVDESRMRWRTSMEETSNMEKGKEKKEDIWEKRKTDQKKRKHEEEKEIENRKDGETKR